MTATPPAAPLSAEAVATAAQCWCDPRTSSTEMDTTLATVFAEKLDLWIETARLHARNEEFWRDLVMQTGRILGGDVYKQEDGGTVDRPLGLKVPEVAAELKATITALQAQLAEASAWRPISEAPKNKRVDLWLPDIGRVTNCFWNSGWFRVEQEDHFGMRTSLVNSAPSHYMDVPPPPAAEKEPDHG